VLPDVNTLTRAAATQAYEQAGVGPEDLDLVELHDCFATAELVHYDNLMLCEEGGAVDFFESGAPWRDGRMPVNVSGGLQSKGHPIAATGIDQRRNASAGPAHNLMSFRPRLRKSHAFAPPAAGGRPLCVSNIPGALRYSPPRSQRLGG
jgi:hypothetical protein